MAVVYRVGHAVRSFKSVVLENHSPAGHANWFRRNFAPPEAPSGPQKRSQMRTGVSIRRHFSFKLGCSPATTVAILGAGLVLSGVNSTKATLIANWNFNALASGTASSSITASHGAGSLDLSQLNNNADANIDGSGSGQNEFGSDVAGKALALQAGSSEVENGKSIVFSLNMSGCQNLGLTYATVRSSTGFDGQNWSYSTDGGAHFSSDGLVGSSISVPASYSTELVNFSSVSALNNNSSILIELTISGATGASGSDHFDNIQFNADTITAVPEPPGWGVIAAVGLLGVGGLHEWRQQRAAGSKLKA